MELIKPQEASRRLMRGDNPLEVCSKLFWSLGFNEIHELLEKRIREDSNRDKTDKKGT